MKAYELQAKEGPRALVLVERKEEALGPTDARVRVRATSINYRDLIIFRGAKSRSAPVVPLSDGAGEVVAVGKDVTRLKVGDKVAANFFPTWREGLLSDAHHAQALGGGHDGMLREEGRARRERMGEFPDHLSFEQAATLPCAVGLTAYHALFEAAHVGPGDTVLVEGTGGVSLFALQLAKAAGARVVLTSKSADKRERATRLGADHVIDYTADPKWGESARAWTGGRGVDVAVEVGGQGTFDQATASLRYGGTLSVIGGLTGVQGGVNLYPLLHKTLRVRGIYVGSVELFERFVRALDSAKIVPVIDETYSFADAGKAYERIASGDHFGKIVIRGGMNPRGSAGTGEEPVASANPGSSPLLGDAEARTASRCSATTSKASRALVQDAAAGLSTADETTRRRRTRLAQCRTSWRLCRGKRLLWRRPAS